MASIGQKTANFDLTQYQQGDTIDFFAEYNADMRKIDAGIGAKSTVEVLGSGEELPEDLDAKTLYLKPTAQGYELYDGTGTKLPVNVLAENVDVNGAALQTVLAGKASTDVATAEAAGLMSALDKSDHDTMAERKVEIGRLTGLDKNIMTKFDDADDALQAHTTDTDNPHGVTAAQAGAMPTTGGTFTGDVNISSGKQIMIGGKEAGTDNYLRWAGYSGTNWWGFHRYIDPDTGNTIFGHVINTVSGTTQIWTCPSNTKTVTFTNAIVNGSDRRLKNNIADMENAKPLIMGLKAKQFRMNSDDSEKTNYGFIAQDVQDVMSAIGIENSGLVIDSGEINGVEHALGLSYTQLIAPMVSVIQEQEQRIAALEERLDRLEQSL